MPLYLDTITYDLQPTTYDEKEIICGGLRVQNSSTYVINLGISHIGFYMR
jgi:hypothetical protein